MERTVIRVDHSLPKQPKVVRVCAYTRVSSGKDAMLHSLSAQVSYYSNLIQCHKGWLYCGVYSDEAITGTKEARAGFQQMLNDCRSGKIDLIITKSVSRFARNTVTLLEAVRELRGLGIDVFFEEQNIHTMSADGELLLTILAGYAEEESRTVSENMRWRVRKNFEEGIPWNCTMLGYRFSEDHFEIVPEEAETVRFIFSEFIKGKSMRAIAAALNEDGILTRKGNRWRETTLDKLLQNSAYTGNLLLQTYYRENYLSRFAVKNNGELPMYQADNTHEAIIDIGTFMQAQELIKQRKAANPQVGVQKNSYPFTGKITCAICGKHYRRKVTQSRIVWICATYNSQGKVKCPSKAIPENKLQLMSSALAFEEITEIIAERDNNVVFCMKDGSRITKHWDDRSRAESWTPEMKARSSERALARYESMRRKEKN